jgi:hypothetical protein
LVDVVFDDKSMFLLLEALAEILVDLSTSPSRSGFAYLDPRLLVYYDSSKSQTKVTRVC